MTNHPIQPLEKDSKGTVRFKANAIVQYLLDNGGIDMNQLATLEFSREDREQFAQLIGYSWSGACDLWYMSSEVLDTAHAMIDGGKSEHEARADVLRKQIEEVKAGMQNGVAALFEIHPDDLR